MKTKLFEQLCPDTIKNYMLSELLYLNGGTTKVPNNFYDDDRIYVWIKVRWMVKYIKALESQGIKVNREAITFRCDLNQEKNYYEVEMNYNIRKLRKEKLKRLNESKD